MFRLKEEGNIPDSRKLIKVGEVHRLVQDASQTRMNQYVREFSSYNVCMERIGQLRLEDEVNLKL